MRWEYQLKGSNSLDVTGALRMSAERVVGSLYIEFFRPHNFIVIFDMFAGIVFHLQQRLKRRLVLVVCGLHRAELGLRAVTKFYSKGTISNTMFRGGIGRLLISDVWKRSVRPVRYAFLVFTIKIW